MKITEPNTYCSAFMRPLTLNEIAFGKKANINVNLNEILNGRNIDNSVWEGANVYVDL